MTIREGSLEAPPRHPIDWNNPEYYDETKIVAEMDRIFDICHGCRRCVSLCNAFPALFDAIDETDTGELDAVPKQKFWDVVDQCYLCDMCYMVKCPYVPPHPWNVDFPHLMLRAKAFQFKHGRMKHPVRDRLLSSTDRNGKLATIPVVVQVVNAAAKSPALRGVGESVMGIHKEAWVPSYTTRKFRSHAPQSKPFAVKDGERTPGKVVVFATCYVNYNEPGVGHDLLKVLEHNEIPYVLAEKENCCGMPKLEQGDLEAVAQLMARNVEQLAPLAKQGYAILTLVPSCTLMFKQELPLLFANDENVLAVRDAMFDPFEYLMARKRDGLLRTDFTKPLGKVAYHVACHTRVQKIGMRTKEGLEAVPGTEVTTIERCSGHAGTWGVKKEFHDIALKIGRPVVRQIADFAPDYFASDCILAGHHLDEGLMRADGKGKAELRHPITLLRMAYGIPD
ncbi:MAG TPA: heterodisulfide reductase-related iron-sulfur binding cluster [Usitatibacter sp.]|nr:heterodisulfide reductase-related iron-sulfur binding cluster [Usitatibacter sp.]